MADPIPFYGHNHVFGAPRGHEATIRPLPCFNNGSETIVCWKLSPEELAHIIATGEVWQSMKTGPDVFPSFVTGMPLMQAFDLDTQEETTYYSDGRNIIDDARQFAILHHGKQTYGETAKPHTYHCAKVVQVLKDFDYGWMEQVGGWLHDTEEDCWTDLPMDQRREFVRVRYGDQVENIVWACTGVMFVDGKKQNRAARNAQIALKVKACPPAAPIKYADRIANMEECVLTQGPLGAMYQKESAVFDDHIGPFVPDAMRLRFWEAYAAIIAYTSKETSL